ncbi:MAG: phosphate acyltransferase PlsX [Oscillospiraceae bacterium]|nr:phosphate acyltransferase PlsX [Oscillospiraceae bacterium]MBP1592945.1 phosphate acyltransferase PlsX [Oscillospiraceae bacterium]
MNVIVDAFGGDNAPDAVIEGSILAVQNLGVKVTLVGDEKLINEAVEKHNLVLTGIDVVHADTVFDIHEEPTEIIKSGKNSSMAVGLGLLHDGKGDAFVSAGSTGALVVGSTFIAKRLKGVKRAALAPIMPAKDGYFMLLDGGANTECRPEALVQFGLMGSAYMEKVMGIKEPRVGLLNIGAEETKGRELEIETYKLLEKSPVNFVGNIEARDMPFSKCDVLVADGYTGNIALKLYEGMGLYFGKTLKNMLTKNLKTKIAAGLLLDQVNEFKKKMDYSEVGGAVLMGIQGTVIKAHGSSDGKAFYNAIRQAKECVETGVSERISSYLEMQKGAE